MDLSGFPLLSGTDLGWLTEIEMIEVDRVMMYELKIDLVQMMENAGRNLARVVLDGFKPSRVAVLAGSGGNGGGGLVAARHLANAGVDVVVTTTRPVEELRGVPRHQQEILDRMGVAKADQPVAADVVIDALVGYSLRGAPRGRTAELIGALNADTPIVSLDSPSGLDVTAGTAPGAVVQADVTMTLALPKIGLRSSPQVGELLLADISVPRSVTAALGPAAPDFSRSSIVRVLM